MKRSILSLIIIFLCSACAEEGWLELTLASSSTSGAQLDLQELDLLLVAADGATPAASTICRVTEERFALTGTDEPLELPIELLVTGDPELWSCVATRVTAVRSGDEAAHFEALFCPGFEAQARETVELDARCFDITCDASEACVIDGDEPRCETTPASAHLEARCDGVY